MIEKPKFVNYTLDEDKKNLKFKPIVIRSNPQMDRQIEDLKDDLSIKETSTVIKKAFIVGYNVIHQELGKDFFKGLLNKK